MSPPTPLRHAWIASTLRSRIADGSYPSGSRLPSEAELIAEFGTSRGPVRQAVDTLRREGLIAVSRGRSPRVLEHVPVQPFETMVSFTEWAEALGRTPGQVTMRVARSRCSEDDAQRLEIDEGDVVVDLLRLRLLDGDPVMLERSVFPWGVGHLLFDPDFDPDQGSIYRYLASRQVDLHRGAHQIDAMGADEVDAQHLGVEVGSPLMRVRRLVTDRKGTPVEYGDDRYLPGTAVISIANTAGENRSALSLIPHRNLTTGTP